MEIVDKFLEVGIHNEYTDWMDSIIHKESLFFASWNVEDGLSLLNELKSIFLGVAAEDSYSDYIFLDIISTTMMIYKQKYAFLRMMPNNFTLTKTFSRKKVTKQVFLLDR